jgi:hypothetical protein
MSDQGVPVTKFGNCALLTGDVSHTATQCCTCCLPLAFSAPPPLKRRVTLRPSTSSLRQIRHSLVRQGVTPRHCYSFVPDEVHFTLLAFWWHILVFRLRHCFQNCLFQYFISTEIFPVSPLFRRSNKPLVQHRQTKNVIIIWRHIIGLSSLKCWCYFCNSCNFYIAKNVYKEWCRIIVQILIFLWWYLTVTMFWLNNDRHFLNLFIQYHNHRHFYDWTSLLSG